jgi:hypothetical protein
MASGDTAWSALSDIRRKKNIQNLSYGLAEILALRPVRFDYIQEESNASKRMGFIAQEAMAVIPEMVSGTEDTAFALATTELIPALVKAIQELKAEIDILKSK